LLRRHWAAFDGAQSILVPFCGKAVDLLWLAGRGLAVTGIELSAIAVEAFFDEQGLAYDTSDAGELTRYAARERPIELFCGDYLRFAGGPYDALFDRGALVAVPAADRLAFARHTDAMLSPDARRMLITLEYDESRVAGPPFSVGAAEVLGYWPELRRAESRNDIDTGSPKFRKAGLDEVIESVWTSA